MVEFLQHLINGLLQGGIYGLVGLGFSLVWGILNIINLAHAAFIMIAAYLTYVLFTQLQLDPFLALLPVMLVMFGLGYLIQFGMLNHLIRAPLLSIFLVTFCLETISITLGTRLFTEDVRTVHVAYAESGFRIPLFTGTLTITWVRLATLVVAVILTLALQQFVTRTRTGNAIRAVGMDLTSAQLMGVDYARIYGITFGLGAAMAAAAGVLLALTNAFGPASFSSYNIKAFTVVVLGGLGSISGSFLAGVSLGLVEEFATVVTPQFTDIIVFSLLILLLVVRPKGLLGKEFY